MQFQVLTRGGWNNQSRVHAFKCLIIFWMLLLLSQIWLDCCMHAEFFVVSTQAQPAQLFCAPPHLGAELTAYVHSEIQLISRNTYYCSSPSALNITWRVEIALRFVNKYWFGIWILFVLRHQCLWLILFIAIFLYTVMLAYFICELLQKNLF